MIIVVDQVESRGKGLFVVQLSIKPAGPGKDFPSIQVRLLVKEDEIANLPLREIQEHAIHKVPELLRSVSLAIEDDTRPAPLG
jgi:hypothetical protein